MLDQAKNIFIVGIKGVAMANIALILQKMGRNVAGSDVSEEFITDKLLKKNNISWQISFKPTKLPKKTDLVIYSAAHQGRNNPQILEAKKRGIQIISQAEFLGKLTKEFKTTIAVCGSHGKTTTSSLLSYALIKLGVNPNYMVGSSSFNDYPGGNFKSKDYFVLEADEYGVNPPQDKTPKFHFLNPEYILCTNIDFDHPDVYLDLNEVKQSFFKFFNGKKLILCADDTNILQYINKLKRNRFVTFGYSEKADLKIINPQITEQKSTFEIVGTIHELSLHETFTISLFGEKNISNAAGVVLLLLQLGFPVEKIKKAIKGFTGAKRRFEKVYSYHDTFLFDDYAHHPREIEATIQAARNRFPQRRIVIIFQPHTYSRTQALLKDFATSLSMADKSFVLPIFPSARENVKDFNVASSDIAKLNPNKITNVASKEDLILHLRSNILHSDIIFTLGAGDVYKLANGIIKLIKTL